ncbi:MAG TPA: MFS transporter [Thermomicrobiales bacterium]|nr:MFS transporter [Thermomicrobiales bacterium]
MEPAAGVTPDHFLDTSAPRTAVVSWALYDLGNTTFSLAIVSLHFPLWVVNDRGGTDAHFTLAVSLSMLLMFLAAPVLGALSDQASRRKPFLVTATLICVSFTALLGTGSIWLSLAFFVVANFAYQAGLLFYDTLLPSVATRENRGRISGFGVAVGYIGSIIAILTALAILGVGGTDARVWVFRVTAVLFLLFALPLFRFVRERERPVSSAIDLGAARQAIRTALGAVASLRQRRDLRNFLLAHLLYADAANTAIAVLGIYATNEVGFSDEQAQMVLLVGIVGAITGGLTIGHVADRIGPRDTLLGVLGMWLVSLTLVATIAWLDLSEAVFWPVAVLVGIALGGLWSADRPLMLQLIPAGRLGEYYGLYSMVGRFAAMLGPLLWAVVVDGVGWGRPTAVAGLAVFIAVAIVLLSRVDNRPVPQAQAVAGPVSP